MTKNFRNLLWEKRIQSFRENKFTVDREQWPESYSNIKGDGESESRKNVVLNATNERRFLRSDLVGSKEVIQQRDEVVTGLKYLQ